MQGACRAHAGRMQGACRAHAGRSSHQDTTSRGMAREDLHVDVEAAVGDVGRDLRDRVQPDAREEDPLRALVRALSEAPHLVAEALRPARRGASRRVERAGWVRGAVGTGAVHGQAEQEEQEQEEPRRARHARPLGASAARAAQLQHRRDAQHGQEEARRAQEQLRVLPADIDAIDLGLLGVVAPDRLLAERHRIVPLHRREELRGQIDATRDARRRRRVESRSAHHRDDRARRRCPRRRVVEHPGREVGARRGGARGAAGLDRPASR